MRRAYSVAMLTAAAAAWVLAFLTMAGVRP
jgi:hypothetical protein